MSTDLEQLMIQAADDTDHPLQTSVDDIVRRGRRSIRHRRIATAATAVLTVAAIAGSAAAWSASRSHDAGVLAPQLQGPPDPATGKAVLPAPPVSPLSDSEIVRRCDPMVGLDDAGITQRANRLLTGGTGSEPVAPGWTVLLKTGSGDDFKAVLASPNRKDGIECGIETFADGGKSPTYAAFSLTADLYLKAFHDGRGGGEVAPNLPLPSGVTRVLVDIPGEASPREVLLGRNGFFTLGSLNLMSDESSRPRMSMIRAYDAQGRKVYEEHRMFQVLPAR